MLAFNNNANTYCTSKKNFLSVKSGPFFSCSQINVSLLSLDVAAAAVSDAAFVFNFVGIAELISHAVFRSISII